MSPGRHPALAGTLTGPSLQASQTPVTSVPPVRERTISRHGSLSGRPQAISRILVPQDVPVSVTVTCTFVTALAPDSVTAAGGGLAPGRLAPGWASQNPPGGADCRSRDGAQNRPPAAGPGPQDPARPGGNPG